MFDEKLIFRKEKHNMKETKFLGFIFRIKTLVGFKFIIFTLPIHLVFASCNLEDEFAKEVNRCGFDYYTFLSNCIDGDASSSAKSAACLLIVDDYQKNCK